MPKVKEQAWSVAADKILQKLKPEMPPAMQESIREEARDRASIDVFGADYKQCINADGTIAENGIGSDHWLVNVATDQQAERHYAAIERFVGPAAAKAAREKTARLKGRK
jgi:hypothetical protein